jgi:ATP-dependent DNA helicase DinG
MARAVARALDERRHLIVQAGTGTGKSLAYLVPLAHAGVKAVVATATKALQDQLATKDLPFLTGAMRGRPPLTFAVLKGRANYLCRQRATEVGGAVDDPGVSGVQLFDPDGETADHQLDVGRFGLQIKRLIAWGERSDTGDRAELEFEPHPRAWAALSVSARECPGAFRCPSGTICFAEQARERAAAADVVVVNTHLYAMHVAGGGGILPDHDVVILDEAHQVEDIMTAALGVEITAGRLRAIAHAARPLLGEASDRADDVAEVADRIHSVLTSLAGQRVLTGSGAHDDELVALLELGGTRLQALAGALRGEDPTDARSDDAGRRTRALLAAEQAREELTRVIALGRAQVGWVESSGPSGRSLTLRAAPVEVGPLLAERLWPGVTAVLTSATVPMMLGTRLGLPPSASDHLDVGSPFSFETCALLYCAAHLPDPRRTDPHGRLHDELATLITAAGGRTLALFTSWRAMHAAVDALRDVLPFRILAQGDLPKPRLIDEFTQDDTSCLFATMSFWQGVDIPGPTLSLVTIDRLPFPRPDDPLVQARRDRAGSAAFRVVDVPRAATLLAQGTGRLIRTRRDRGVVAVLDPRLAHASYGRMLVSALPPMRRTTDRDEVIAFLHEHAHASS